MKRTLGSLRMRGSAAGDRARSAMMTLAPLAKANLAKARPMPIQGVRMIPQLLDFIYE